MWKSTQISYEHKGWIFHGIENCKEATIDDAHIYGYASINKKEENIWTHPDII